jgi:hypothetical protein
MVVLTREKNMMDLGSIGHTQNTPKYTWMLPKIGIPPHHPN